MKLSLFWKLMLAFAVVVLISLSAVVFLANQVATSELHRFMMGDLDDQGSGMGQGGMMGSGMMSMMMGQPLTQEQLEQFAKQHGITPEQAKQMTDQCHQTMGTTATPETQPKQ